MKKSKPFILVFLRARKANYERIETGRKGKALRNLNKLIVKDLII